MTLTWHSRDGHWKVEGISVDTDGHGFKPKFRVWHDRIGTPSGELLLHWDVEVDKGHTRRWLPFAGRRIGPQYGAGGWVLAADVWPASEVEQFVPWDELEEVCPVIDMRQHRKVA